MERLILFILDSEVDLFTIVGCYIILLGWQCFYSNFSLLLMTTSPTAYTTQLTTAYTILTTAYTSHNSLHNTFLFDAKLYVFR